MRKMFRIVGTVLSIAAIALFLDAVATATVLKGLVDTDRDAAEAGNLGVYIQRALSPRHHPRHRDAARVGSRHLSLEGRQVRLPYRHLRARRGREGVAGDLRHRQFLRRGAGLELRAELTGLMACDAARQKKAVWNLGVVVLQPDHLLAEDQGGGREDRPQAPARSMFSSISPTSTTRPTSIARSQDGSVLFKSKSEPSPDNWRFDPGQWLVQRLSTARLVYDTAVSSASFTWDRSVGHDRARWPFDRS